MGHNHAHDHSGCDHGNVTNVRMGWSVALTLAFVAVEATVGWWADSLGLLSDAGHNLSDAAALLLSWWAMRAADRPATRGMTYGFHRVGILAALVNALALVVMAVWIFYEAIERLRTPAEVQGVPMIVTALIAVAMNLLIGSWLHAGRHDLNIRSAYIHMLGDAASSGGVALAGLFIALTGNTLADPLVSLLVGVLVLVSSWQIIRESVVVLLEGTPAGLDMVAVESSIKLVPGVLAAHDLHVWMIGSGVIACSCHVVVAEQSVTSGQRVREAVETALHEQFRINHTTIQVETEGCESAAMYCSVETLRKK